MASAKRLRAAAAKECILASRSALPVSSVTAHSPAPDRCGRLDRRSDCRPVRSRRFHSGPRMPRSVPARRAQAAARAARSPGEIPSMRLRPSQQQYLGLAAVGDSAAEIRPPVEDSAMAMVSRRAFRRAAIVWASGMRSFTASFMRVLMPRSIGASVNMTLAVSCYYAMSDHLQ